MAERVVQHESWGPLGQGRNDLFTNAMLTEIATAAGTWGTAGAHESARRRDPTGHLDDLS
jgi:hypothetical protein